MMRECKKCGFAGEADAGPMAACPNCGAIYAKMAMSAADQAAAEPAPAPPVPRQSTTPRVAPPPVQATLPPTWRQRDHAEGDVAHQGAGIVEKILWLWTMIAGLGAASMLVYSYTTAQSAVQQGAGAAMAAAVVIVPYCLARAVQIYTR